MCYATHRAIDCVLELVHNSPIQAGDVKKISVSISDNASKVLRNTQPETGLAAKFSIQFAMASGIIAKRVGLRELTDGFVQRSDVRDLMGKVEVVTTSEYDPEMPGAAKFDSVAVELNDGRTFAGAPVARATGHPTRPLTEVQLYEKFADCLDAGDSEIAAEVLFKRLSRLQSISARELTAR
jgi:2-methylcitrate dehydratase PrpD